MRPEVLAVIPARGGSKGVLNKNLRNVGGRPLIQRAVDAARTAATVTRTVVSTDSMMVTDAAIAAGAEVLPRLPHLATDTAKSDDVIIDVLRTLDQDPRYAAGAGPSRYRPDWVVLLFPTSPFRSPGLVDRCVRRAIAEDVDSLFTARRGHFVWTRDDVAGYRCNAEPLHARPNRQQMTPDQERFLEVGSVYVFRPAIILETGCRIGGRVALELVDGPDTLEIDTAWDLALADAAALAAEIPRYAEGGCSR